jgi:hypothetical protein
MPSSSKLGNLDAKKSHFVQKKCIKRKHPVKISNSMQKKAAELVSFA